MAHKSNNDLPINTRRDIITTYGGNSYLSHYVANKLHEYTAGRTTTSVAANKLNIFLGLHSQMGQNLDVGGHWCNTKRTKEDTTWIEEGMQEGTLIWTTDGSYDRKRVVDLLGAGWIIFCKQAGLNLTGLFWEMSPTAKQKCLACATSIF